MSTPFRDLARRVGSMPGPDIDVDALIEKGEARLRLRRVAAVVGTSIVIVLAVMAAEALTLHDDRRTLPVTPPVQQGYALLPDVGGDLALEAGRYALTPIGPSSGPLAVLDVPAGFVGNGQLLFPADASATAADECCIVGYWTVARVYQDPCKAKVAKDPGPSVQDLADALTAQRTTSTKPTPVTLGGHDGVYLELTAPAGLGELSTCKSRNLAYWESDPGTRHFDASHYVPSKGLPVEKVWILDVDGQRVLLSVGVESGVSEQQAQQLVDIVESTTFVTG